MSAKAKRILVFDQDGPHHRHLLQVLPDSEWEISFEQELYQATQRFKNRPFDFVISCLDMPDDEGEEFAFWVCENYPKRKVILIGSPNQDYSEQVDDLRQNKSVLGFLPKPVPGLRLCALLDQQLSGLEGQVQRMNLIDLLQIMRMNKPQCLISFNDKLTRQEGILYLSQGEVVHAELYETSPKTLERVQSAVGIEAFNRIVQFKNGEFHERNWSDPAEITIQQPFDSLSMNAATFMDEGLGPMDPFASVQENTVIRNILLVDTDPMSRMIIQRALFAEGFNCISLKTPQEAMMAIDGEPIDLVITDTLSQHSFLKWLQKNYPQSPVVAIVNASNEDLDELDKLGKARLLAKPIDLRKLKQLLAEIGQTGFKGFLSQIGVFDFIQLNLSATDRKKLHIRDLATNIDAKVYIDRGRFVHAVYKDLEGEEAFFKIIAIENGDFFEDPSFDPPKDTLSDIMPHKLMIKAARFLPIKAAEPTPVSDSDVGGLTSLFGDDDVPLKLTLNPLVQPEGRLELFGDEEKIHVGIGAPAGGITSIFGTDDAFELKPVTISPISTTQLDTLFGDEV
jgi:DNA-binding response OmpR family regulator